MIPSVQPPSARKLHRPSLATAPGPSWRRWVRVTPSSDIARTSAIAFGVLPDVPATAPAGATALTSGARAAASETMAKANARREFVGTVGSWVQWLRALPRGPDVTDA